MKITFVTPRIHRDTFTGGLYCILRHASELSNRGHTVSVVAYPKSKIPNWIDLKANLITPRRIKWRHDLSLGRAALSAVGYLIDYTSCSYKGDYYPKATSSAYLSDILPEADITIATFWETAALVAKYGKGRKAYFCQHYEPLFFDDPVGHADADATYLYGLSLIANSSWLKSRLENRLLAAGNNQKVYLATNAIDPAVFAPSDGADLRPESVRSHLRVISYGGRGARWKGFLEMAEAVHIARKELPSVHIEWSVYGPALLPANNTIAPYTHLGFLSQPALASAYRMNDVLLSASWYESFPLFPIEAMASGLAVITSAYGTEDYALDNRNCLIIDPHNVQSIADAIIRLALDRKLLKELGLTARQVAHDHNWGVASSAMEKLLQQLLSTSPH